MEDTRSIIEYVVKASDDPVTSIMGVRRRIDKLLYAYEYAKRQFAEESRAYWINKILTLADRECVKLIRLSRNSQ